MFTKKRSPYLLYLLSFVICFFSFSLHITTITTTDTTRDVDEFSDGIMIADLMYHSAYNGNHVLLQQLNTEINSSFTHDRILSDYLEGTAPAESWFQSYSSNTVLQRYLYRAICSIVREKEVALTICYLINATCLAGVISLIICLLSFLGDSLLYYGIALFCVAFWMPALNSFSTNLYWSTWALLLPFSVALFDCAVHYKKYMDGQIHFASRFWIIFGVCLLNWLFHFEFATTVMVSLMLPYIYLWIASFEKRRLIFGQIEMLIVPAMGALSSFIAAVFIRIILTGIEFGSLQSGMSSFYQNIVNRVTDQDTGDAGQYANLTSAELIQNASRFTAIEIKDILQIDFFFILTISIACLVGINLFTWRQPSSCYVKRINLLALDAVFGCSLFGTASWFILARPHATVHLWLTPILFFIPTVFLALLILVMTAEYVVRVILFSTHKIKSEPCLFNKERIHCSRVPFADAISATIGFLLAIDLIFIADTAITVQYISNNCILLGESANAGFKLYQSGEGDTLYYVGGPLKMGEYVFIHLFPSQEYLCPSFYRQPVYNNEGHGVDYLNYTFTLENQQISSKLILSGFLRVAKVDIPAYCYSKIDWGIYQPTKGQRFQQMITIPSYEAETPNIIIPANISDGNWVNGISRTDPSVVLIQRDGVSAYGALNKTYRIDDNTIATIIDITPDNQWMQLKLSDPINSPQGAITGFTLIN